MKLSVADKLGRFVGVRLDGFEMRNCLLADEEAGVVVVLDMENLSKRKHLDELPTKNIYGNVELFLLDCAPPEYVEMYGAIRKELK